MPNFGGDTIEETRERLQRAFIPAEVVDEYFEGGVYAPTNRGEIGEITRVRMRMDVWGMLGVAEVFDYYKRQKIAGEIVKTRHLLVGVQGEEGRDECYYDFNPDTNCFELVPTDND